MVELDTDKIVSKLREMANRNQYAHEVFEYFSNRRYNASFLVFDRIKTLIPAVPEAELLSLFKEFEAEGLGRIIWGRNGASKTQFMWYYAIIDVGKAGLGYKDTITALNSMYSADEDIFSRKAARCKVELRGGEFSSTVVLPRDYTPTDIEGIIAALRQLPMSA